LVSALQVYPPTSGGNIRTFNLAKGLAQHGHHVSIVSLIGRKGDLGKGASQTRIPGPEHIEEFVLRPFGLTLLGILSFKLGLFPFWAWAWLKILGPFSKKLNDLIQGSEVVIADFPFLYSVFAAAPKKIRVLNTHNIETRLARGRISKYLVSYLETKACESTELIAACSASDGAYFSKLFKAKVLVIPNTIDRTQFSKDLDKRLEIREELKMSDRKVCLFSASAYGPNLEAFEFLKSFARRHSDFMEEKKIVFLVIGSVAPKDISDENFLVLGRVESVAPYFLGADFALNPIFRGEGTSIKVAEYLAAELPLLTTSIGARGYNLAPGESAFFFSGEDFKDQLEALINHPQLHRLTVKALEDNKASYSVKGAAEPLCVWIESRKGKANER